MKYISRSFRLKHGPSNSTPFVASLITMRDLRGFSRCGMWLTIGPIFRLSHVAMMMLPRVAKTVADDGAPATGVPTEL